MFQPFGVGENDRLAHDFVLVAGFDLVFTAFCWLSDGAGKTCFDDR